MKSAHATSVNDHSKVKANDFNYEINAINYFFFKPNGLRQSIAIVQNFEIAENRFFICFRRFDHEKTESASMEWIRLRFLAQI